eukprot:GEMP01014710.1.p1 GENE.GEMP01014710.1~~GEMP01014710.1.p1  ORF type:complete len:533 (+),score=124.92 GEMP01014710.1:76-1674(+)
MVDIFSRSAVDDPAFGVPPEERRTVTLSQPGSAGIVFSRNFEVIEILPTADEVLTKASWLEPGAHLCSINGQPPIQWKTEATKRPCVLEFTPPHCGFISRPPPAQPESAIALLWRTHSASFTPATSCVAPTATPTRSRPHEVSSLSKEPLPHKTVQHKGSVASTLAFQWPRYGHGPSGVTRTRRANLVQHYDTPAMHHEVCSIIQEMRSLERDIYQHCDASRAATEPISTVEVNNMPNAMHPARAPLSRFGNLTMPEDIIRQRRLHAAQMGPTSMKDFNTSSRFFQPRGPVREVEVEDMRQTSGPRPIVPVLLPALRTLINARKPIGVAAACVEDVEPDELATGAGPVAEMIELQHYPGYKCRLRDMCQCHTIVDAYHAEFAGVKRMHLKRHDQVKPNWAGHETLAPSGVKSINCDMCATRLVGRLKDVKGKFFMCRKCKSKNNRYELCEKCHTNVQHLLATSKHFQEKHPPAAFVAVHTMQEAYPKLGTIQRIYCDFCGRHMASGDDTFFVCKLCRDDDVCFKKCADCSGL